MKKSFEVYAGVVSVIALLLVFVSAIQIMFMGVVTLFANEQITAINFLVVFWMSALIVFALSFFVFLLAPGE